MKPTEQEITAAMDIAYKKAGHNAYYGNGFRDGAQWAISLQPEWVPIAQYPDKDIPLVLRWHKLWKCPVAVQHRRAYAENGCEWLGGTRDNTWPEEAFEPFFQYLPQPPTT